MFKGLIKKEIVGGVHKTVAYFRFRVPVAIVAAAFLVALGWLVASYIISAKNFI